MRCDLHVGRVYMMCKITSWECASNDLIGRRSGVMTYRDVVIRVDVFLESVSYCCQVLSITQIQYRLCYPVSSK